jgi:hypothetical protein
MAESKKRPGCRLAEFHASGAQLKTSNRRGSPRSSEDAGSSKADDQLIPYRSQATRRQCQPCGRCRIAADSESVRRPEIDVNYYRRWDLNPHGRYRPEDFKSSASAIPPRRLLRRSTDRQELPQKERARTAGPVRGRRRRSVDSHSVEPEGGIRIHNQQEPVIGLRDRSLLGPIYESGQGLATDPPTIRGHPKRTPSANRDRNRSVPGLAQ